MTHDHQPITHEHEIICSQCGVVIANAIEYPHLQKQSMLIINLEHNVQGFGKSNYMHYGIEHEKYYTEQSLKVYMRLRNIVDKEHLPLHYATDTMKILLARKRGLWSIKWQIITLIQVLTNTNDSRLRNHIRHLKKEYKNAKGT